MLERRAHVIARSLEPGDYCQQRWHAAHVACVDATRMAQQPGAIVECIQFDPGQRGPCRCRGDQLRGTVAAVRCFVPVKARGTCQRGGFLTIGRD